MVGVLFKGWQMPNVDLANLAAQNHSNQPWIPIFFITVACGIMSGFHATQATLISRSVTDEREGKATFFNMMLLEGFIAMIWAAGAMTLFSNKIQPESASAVAMIGHVSRYFLGGIGAAFAIIGVIVLPITSGDTALRSLRLIIAERFNIDQKPASKRIAVTTAIFLPVVAILYFSKLNPDGFQVLWRYFAFVNQFIAIFALSMITVYLYIHKKNYWIALLPGMFYTFIVMSFIIHAKIGFNLIRLEGESYNITYIISAVITAIYAYLTVTYGKKKGISIENIKF